MTIIMRSKVSAPRGVLRATFRLIVFTALAATLSSCTTYDELHEPARAILEAARCKPGPPVVGLGPAVDARRTQVIGIYGLVKESRHIVAVGTELADYASDALASCLVAKGYCVQRDQPSSARLVGIVLFSADLRHWWERAPVHFESPVDKTRAAEIKVEVRDSSSQKVFFVGNYSSVHAIDSINPSTVMFDDLSARYLEQVNKAIDDAVKKACNDPAFIAAITPPSGLTPR